MALDRGGARIIVSASGMGSGGRVTHHLKALLPDPSTTVLLVGAFFDGRARVIVWTVVALFDVGAALMASRAIVFRCALPMSRSP